MKFKILCIALVTIGLQACKKDALSLYKIEGKQITISDSLAIDQDIENFIKPYREHVNNDLDSIICYAPETYSKKEGELNTNIGNLIADLVFEESNPIFNKKTGKNIDAVLLNNGGIRSIISKGNITTRTAYQVMPFENSIVVVALKGNQLDSMVTYLSKAKLPHPIQGMKITLDKDYNITEALIQGKPIDTTKTYYLATNDYLYSGGDGMRFFQPNEGLITLDYKLRDATIDYFKRVDTIKPVIDNRFTRTK